MDEETTVRLEALQLAHKLLLDSRYANAATPERVIGVAEQFVNFTLNRK